MAHNRQNAAGMRIALPAPSGISAQTAKALVQTLQQQSAQGISLQEQAILLQHVQHPFDGKRMRKTVYRKTVDFNSSVIRHLQNRVWLASHDATFMNRSILQPDSIYSVELTVPQATMDLPARSACTKHVRTSTNKLRSPINCVCWTPDARRVVTGANSGEFTLWNGQTFNFETISQAHETPVRVMTWSHNEQWLVSGEQAGYLKFWQPNINSVKMFQAHKECVRALAFSHCDRKFATCSDDSTVRIFDFETASEERVLRGHGADVRSVSWHPTKSLIVSGSKDAQQPVKMWDPRSGQSVVTLYAHKSTVTDVKWNALNGHWFVTASRDASLKVFDVRSLKRELLLATGHRREVCCVAWHPIQAELLASGDAGGTIKFWLVAGGGTGVGSQNVAEPVAAIESAHDGQIWSMEFHPLGHTLASGSNDFTTKFWTRPRPGDVRLTDTGLYASLASDEHGTLPVVEADSDEQLALGAANLSSLTGAVGSGANAAARAQQGGTAHPQYGDAAITPLQRVIAYVPSASGVGVANQPVTAGGRRLVVPALELLTADEMENIQLSNMFDVDPIARNDLEPSDSSSDDQDERDRDEPARKRKRAERRNRAARDRETRTKRVPKHVEDVWNDVSGASRDRERDRDIPSLLALPLPSVPPTFRAAPPPGGMRPMREQPPAPGPPPPFRRDMPPGSYEFEMESMSSAPPNFIEPPGSGAWDGPMRGPPQPPPLPPHGAPAQYSMEPPSHSPYEHGNPHRQFMPPSGPGGMPLPPHPHGPPMPQRPPFFASEAPADFAEFEYGPEYDYEYDREMDMRRRTRPGMMQRGGPPPPHFPGPPSARLPLAPPPSHMDMEFRGAPPPSGGWHVPPSHGGGGFEEPPWQQNDRRRDPERDWNSRGGNRR